MGSGKRTRALTNQTAQHFNWPPFVFYSNQYAIDLTILAFDSNWYAFEIDIKNLFEIEMTDEQLALEILYCSTTFRTYVDIILETCKTCLRSFIKLLDTNFIKN